MRNDSSRERKIELERIWWSKWVVGIQLQCTPHRAVAECAHGMCTKAAIGSFPAGMFLHPLVLECKSTKWIELLNAIGHD